MSASGIPNLAIVSSVLHLSSSPAVIGFMQRPTTVPRHTYSNIKETGYFTINHVQRDFIDKAHYTSAKFEKQESEFQQCELSEEYLDDFLAPFVKESLFKLAVSYIEEYEIKASNTIMMVGGIQSVYLPEASLQKDGNVDLNGMDAVCISGLNHYHRVSQIATFGYARPGVFPMNSFKNL
jgi:flavin reductase (DIM6/NTAB) family NADH-FMN oxidoreductase RutF